MRLAPPAQAAHHLRIEIEMRANASGSQSHSSRQRQVHEALHLEQFGLQISGKSRPRSNYSKSMDCARYRDAADEIDAVLGITTAVCVHGRSLNRCPASKARVRKTGMRKTRVGTHNA